MKDYEINKTNIRRIFFFVVDIDYILHILHILHTNNRTDGRVAPRSVVVVDRYGCIVREGGVTLPSEDDPLFLGWHKPTRDVRVRGT